MGTPGVAASCLATDLISALVNLVKLTDTLLAPVLHTLGALCSSNIARVGLPGKWGDAFGEILLAATIAQGQPEVDGSIVELVTSLRSIEGGLDILLLHHQTIFKLKLPEAELAKTVHAMVGNQAESIKLLKSGVLKLFPPLLMPPNPR